ncbi:MAG: hypothetical protein ACTHK6_11240 [Solirubrobacterales bacterium]
MKRLKAPELKLSEMKVPQVLQDLYWDLRDRRLLPLMGLILVAIVAAPFLLGGGEKKPEPVAPPPVAGGSSAREASLTVLPAEPGLREPSKRLAHRTAKDPFRQHFTGPVLNPGSAPIEESSGGGSGSSGEVVEGSSGGSESSPSTESLPAPVESGGGGSGGSGGGGSNSVPAPAPGEIELFTFAIKVRIAHTEFAKDGTRKMSEFETREEVLPTTPLPGKKSPALTYLGVDPKDGKEAMMLVSPEVTGLFGDNECISGTSTCQLLALKPKTLEAVEYGPNGVRYKIEVLEIKPVKSGKAKINSE